MKNQERIDRAVEALNSNGKELRAQALQEGFKDKVCGECGAVFLAHSHFVRCNSVTCPMVSRNAQGQRQTLLDMAKALESDINYQI